MDTARVQSGETGIVVLRSEKISTSRYNQTINPTHLATMKNGKLPPAYSKPAALPPFVIFRSPAKCDSSPIPTNLDRSHE
jgi:hypothetical protein